MITAILGTIAFIAIVGIIFLVWYTRCLKNENKQLVLGLDARVKEAKGKALLGQRNYLTGKLAERFCPFTPEYPYNPADVVAIFNTFDYMVLVGRNELARNNDNTIREVVFQEMKTGLVDNSLKKAQESLRECIVNRRVRWETWDYNRRSKKWHRRKDAGKRRIGELND